MVSHVTGWFWSKLAELSFMSSKQSPSFKAYEQNQLQLLPPSLESLVPLNHPVRVVNSIIDQLDLSALYAGYHKRGASSYHPRMMLKVLVYGYLRNIFSSRKLEMSIQEHVHFMWLAGGNQPDHNSINRFRSNHLKGHIKTIFSAVVLLLHQAGHLDIKTLYTDGTKLEANANRYTFVWAKSIKRNRERIAAQLKEMWAYAESVAREELMDTKPCDFDKLDPTEVAATISKIDQALQSADEVDKKQKQKVKYAAKNWPETLGKYQAQEKILGKRNSYSKTDPDATFMRMKEDHMRNGQLKPGYNLQMSTNDQFIIHYSLHQDATDTRTLKPHLDEFESLYEQLPDQLIADAGYGSEQNYEYLANKEVEAFVKYNYFHKEQKKSSRAKYPFHPNELHYNPQKDAYICPMGQEMKKIGTYIKKKKTGYQQQITKYQAANCTNCPLRGACHKSKTNRIIEVNHRLNAYKQQARDRLNSEEGIEKRKQRNTDVEAVFGILKQNRGFKRLTLRSLAKVEIEVGLHAMAHNFRKLTARLLDKVSKEPLLPIHKMEWA